MEYKMIKTLIVMLPILASVVSAMYIGINYVNEFEVQFANQAEQIAELENKLDRQSGNFNSRVDEMGNHHHDDMRNIIENNKRSMDLLRRMIDEMSRDKEEITNQIAEANRISTENRARMEAMFSTVERKVSDDVFHSLKQQVETIGHKHEDAVRMWLELERRINELDNK
jgi:HPt (histidine-containing phosphotransfer) domain-containing protein